MLSRRTLLYRSTIALCSLGTPWLGHASASVQEPAARAIPAEVMQSLPSVQAAGQARMRFFGLSIYDIQLWVTPAFSPRTYAQQPLALTLTYLRKLDGRAIAQRSLSEMQRIQKIPEATASRWLAAMQDAFPDVGPGDTITGIHHPTAGAQFWVNGNLRARIEDPAFSKLFFGIWLAETTSEPRMRQDLLSSAPNPP